MYKRYNQIDSIVGNVVTVRARGVSYGELAEIQSDRGKSLAEVIKIDEELVHLQIFAGTIGVSTDAQIRFMGRTMGISFSHDLLGRVFDGSGRPMDKGGELLDEVIEIQTPPVNPARRTIPNKMIRTGIPMIDLYNTLVVSQKLPIFSSSGEDYNSLLARVALQAKVDVIILGGIGLKYDEYLYFKNYLDQKGARDRSVMFIHTASAPVVESLVIPDMALAVGERFALEGKEVLVLLTDMSNYAEALKEIAIIMEQVPSNRGYPGDLYTQLAARYEKAVDFVEAGSLTILAVTTMPDDDVTHPIPDNTGYITEGQLYLQGGRITPFGSLSRLKQLVNKKTRPDHREIMDGTIRLYASCQETREKQALGFQMTDWDEKLLDYGRLFEERLMDLEVNIPLERGLDTCWEILNRCFAPEETGIRTDLIEKYWPGEKEGGSDGKSSSE